MSNLITTQVLLANPKPDHLVSVKLFDLYHHHRGWVLLEKEKNVYRLFIERAAILNLNNNPLRAPYGNHYVLPPMLRDITQ